MIVMIKCNIYMNTEYKKVDSLDDIPDKLRYIGKDGQYDVYFGMHDDIYFVENYSMTRKELIKRLSYRDQFDKPIVDNKGLGTLLNEVIAMLEADDDIIQDLTAVVEYYHDNYKEVKDGKMDGNK